MLIPSFGRSIVQGLLSMATVNSLLTAEDASNMCSNAGTKKAAAEGGRMRDAVDVSRMIRRGRRILVCRGSSMYNTSHAR